MKTYQPADIRNFAIVGHASSGKTMLGEAMLACGGVISRMGRIADGSTVSDYHVSEKQRQISVSASAAARGMGGEEVQPHRHAGLSRFHQRRAGRVARRRFRAGGHSRPARPRRGHRTGVELRDALRHPEDDCGQCAWTRRTWILTPCCSQARERFGRHVFPLSGADQSRPRFQPGAGCVAQRRS